MIYGSIAAVAWGLSTIAAANAARRIGAHAAVLLGQCLGAAALMLLAVLLRPSFSVVGGVAGLGLVAAGLLGLLGWVSYYQALARGPVGPVSAIGATYGGVAVILAVAILGDHLGDAGTAGVALTVAGVTMVNARGAGPASTVPRHAAAARPVAAAALAGRHAAAVAARPVAAPAVAGRHAAPPRHLPGPLPLAFASALTFGVSAFLLGTCSARAGWLTSALVEYVASVIALAATMPFRRRLSLRRLGTPGMAWAVAAGISEVAALLAFARGGQEGQVAVTAAVSSLYPAIPLAAGLLLFRERLNWRQALGAGAIVTGLVLIGLA